MPVVRGAALENALSAVPPARALSWPPQTGKNAVGPSWVRTQGARRSPWYFGKGKTHTSPALAREQQFSETARRNPKGRGGFSLPTSGTPSGEKWEPDLELSKGYFSRIGPGLMLEAPSLRGGQGGGRGWSEWPSLKRDFSSRLPTSLLPGASDIRLLLFALAACQVTGPDCFFPPLPFTA